MQRVLFGSSISLCADYSQEENYTSHKTLSQPSLGVYKSFPYRGQACFVLTYISVKWKG